MTAIFVLLIVFLAIGVLARSYNRQMRVLMSMAIIVAILYMYISRGN